MTTSTFAQPLPPGTAMPTPPARTATVARWATAKWHVYSAMAAAGLWTNARDLARFAIEGAKGRARRPGSRHHRRLGRPKCSVRSAWGDFAVGFSIARQGQGWYFSHSGGNWGFTCFLIAHKAKGYGTAVMTNASGGGQVFREVVERIQRAYGWDSLDKPVLR